MILILEVCANVLVEVQNPRKLVVSFLRGKVIITKTEGTARWYDNYAATKDLATEHIETVQVLLTVIIPIHLAPEGHTTFKTYLQSRQSVEKDNKVPH